MPADVRETAQYAIVTPYDDDRLVRHRQRMVIARIRKLVCAADRDPIPSKYTLHFEIEGVGIRVGP